MVWQNDNEKLDLTIHMKDNKKVKNKKRWSQVMYMSYVLDMRMKNDDPVETYILTTDADVSFTSNSVEALLDLMTRDHTVGAVCARTHPLGTGPLVWYQIFEYAIGHWFQKASEHVIGSVLCSPGCFSVYRCKAIRDVLPEYATDVNVKQAIDFLTKDMGEDRWLCTLFVQKGWRIEYCAAAENSTFCPDGFDEFFKQRRRWIASTLANMMLFIRDWSKVAKVNPHLTIIFYVYQVLLLISTLIGPSSVILVVSGGLKYAWDVRSLDSVIIQIVVCFAYTLTCLLTPEKTQLWVSKLLTFVYAVIMTVVVVGIAIEVVSDFGKDITPNKDVNAKTTLRPSIISPDIKFSTTTVYLGCMAALYLVTGFLHLRECIHLVHGLWYLLFLPSGYLILMIYSICNITDIGWGTREEGQTDKSSNLLCCQQFDKIFKSIFFCFFKENRKESSDIEAVVDEESTRDNEDTHPESSNGGAKNDADQTPAVKKENDFWKEALQAMSLVPQKNKKKNKEDRKVLLAKLADLRNKWLMIFTVSNTIWLVLIITLANKRELFSVFGSNPVGFVVLVLFSVVTAIQFLAMLVHRLVTFIHFLARAPYTLKNSDQPNGDRGNQQAQNQQRNAIQEAWRNFVNWFSNVRNCTKKDERRPLIERPIN